MKILITLSFLLLLITIQSVHAASKSRRDTRMSRVGRSNRRHQRRPIFPDDEFQDIVILKKPAFPSKSRTPLIPIPEELPSDEQERDSVPVMEMSEKDLQEEVTRSRQKLLKMSKAIDSLKEALENNKRSFAELSLSEVAAYQKVGALLRKCDKEANARIAIQKKYDSLVARIQARNLGETSTTLNPLSPKVKLSRF